MTVQHIRKLRRQASLDVVFLMETKNQNPYVLKELEFMDTDHHFLVPPERPSSGGLALFWKQDLNLQILSSSKNVIDTMITHKGATVYTTFVYGEPEVPNRSVIWDSLIDLSLHRNEAWLLTGDFNEIVDNNEKSGGPERAEGTFGAFRDMLARCDLFDLKHSGNNLSWRGKRHSHMVYCRPDRTVVNPAWSDRFPTGRCQYLNFESSDHRPLITVFDSPKRHKGRLFRYDRRLRDNEDVKKLIMEVWNGNTEAPVNTRLAMCRRAISSWTREQHVNSKEEIGRLKQCLEVAMTDPQGDETLITALNSKLRIAYKAEEDFWLQRSRIMWLSLGDKNSGYFHAIAKGRRARNRLTVIEGEDGTAYYEEDQIAHQIGLYFLSIYTSEITSETTSATRDIVTSAPAPRISASHNENIVLIPDAAEIKMPCFSSIRTKHQARMASRQASSTPTGALSDRL